MFIELVMIIDEREKQNRKNLQIIETARTQDMWPLRAQTFLTPPRTPRISRLKSQIMKPTFLS